MLNDEDSTQTPEPPLPAAGSLQTGTVAEITDYGAWMTLDSGARALLLIPEISWGRVRHPTEVLAVGEVLRVKVLHVDPEGRRVSLSLKHLSPDPWASAARRFPVGAAVRGRVIHRVDYGVFVEVAFGVEGLVLLPEWRYPVSLGDLIEVRVLSVDGEDRKMRLSMCPLPGAGPQR
jgi:small subunit ribosomal protein S1